ncbi:hypothetical protein M430DRAFT_140007 [Amorphotheca resinae ATCC 22711]|uniref:separase n=1 Tax=Amorphotheca resinae ATCC 22711 TaxID=857342 RepID=A0A2T3B234_AMORE|nr:hypothetical protein M430DRAFT_140007 [Amorphotheca resinae ATCC 22711]PSS18621.1 hypothetical protein M430DRAFT_140007 [Amorphotheca resinae ATCC 22711]
MASLQATADSIRAAVASTSTCSPATATILNDLLLPKSNGSKTATVAVPEKASKTPGGKGIKTPAKPRVRKAEKENAQEHGNQLSPKERSILATEVINATLKALSEAIKSPAASSKKDSSKDLAKGPARKALRRSNSLPQSPLQPRSLNRVTSSPSISTKGSRPSSSDSTTSSGTRAVAECARTAFACLRALQASKIPALDLPPLQLENGMSVLIGKLISLGLNDLAIKEIRILKKRLDSDDRQPVKGGPLSKPNSTVPAPQTLVELLEFGDGSFSGAKLGLIITTQLQVLRLIVSSRNCKHAEAALPLLQPSHSSSPTRFLLLAAKELKSDKCARQLQSLSEILLSLSPSISPADDDVALEPRLSVAPEVAMQLQTLALHNRALWWKLAGHKGDLVKEAFDPFLRCLSAFARRNRRACLETYRLSVSAFQSLQKVFPDLEEMKVGRARSTLLGIYRLLGSMAQEVNLIDEAIDWTQKVMGLLDPKVDSDAKRCAVAARLVGFTLRRSTRHPKDEEPLLNLLEALERPFKGDSSEIDDLLTEVSMVRRAGIAIIAKRGLTGYDFTDGMREMCESLILMCPRLSLRYLGSPPDLNAPTKDILRYEQRRQFIMKGGMHAIDSTLFLIKTFLGEGRLTWELMDSKLQECLLLLERLDGNSKEPLPENGPSTPSYYVRISNLYFTQYLNMRRDSKDQKDGQQIRALRRSIDSVRSRPQHERKAALLSTKLERMAENCKVTGRYDELFKTLLNLRDEMILNGALSVVAAAAATRPVRAAWSQDEDTTVLGRTIQSLVKVQIKYLGSSPQTSLLDGSWSDDERGAILEHILDILSSSPNPPLNLQTKVFKALLSVYDRQRYPIRRIRVLGRLFSLDPAQRQAIAEDTLDEFDLSTTQDPVIEGTNDEGLQGFLKHLQTLNTTLLELQQDKPQISVFKQSFVVWSTIRAGCNDLNSLELQIEDLPTFLVHLQSIADFMQMKGLDTTRLALLRLIKDFNELREGAANPDDFVLSLIHLGTQWIQLGYSGKAGLTLDRAQGYCHQNGALPHTWLQLHLAYAEYLQSIGNFDKSEEHLLQAQAISLEEKEHDSNSRSPMTLQERNRKNQLVANAYLLYSMLALERGTPQLALTHAKQSVRLLRRAWTNTEERLRSQQASICSCPQTETEKLAENVSDLNLSTVSTPTPAEKPQSLAGSKFWALITPLFRSLSYLSGLYAHHGMFQETMYYAEQAHKLVKEVGSEAHTAIASASLGSLWLKAGSLDKGAEFLMEAKGLSSCSEKSRNSAILSYHLGNMQGLLGDRDAELAAYEEVGTILKSITGPDFINAVDHIVDPAGALEEKMSQLTISKGKSSTRKIEPRTRAVAKRKTAARVKAPAEVSSSVTEECPQLMSLKAMILRQRAQVLMCTKKFADALGLLHEAESYSNSQIDAVNQSLAMAKRLFLQSMEQMDADPLYSVLPESTISFPSVVGTSKVDKNNGERISGTRLSSPGKSKSAKNAPGHARSKSPSPDSFFDKLRQAQEYLTEVHSIAVMAAPVAVVHSISSLLNNVAMLLSAAGQVKGKSLAHPGFASSFVETARTIALRRERKAIHADPQTKLKLDDSCWPTLNPVDPKRASLGLPSDMSRFQKDYIDIIPKAWTAISISLSDSRNELTITKLQAGHSPFVLRLPLGRNNSIDADEEVFGFAQGHAELMEIIDLANESAHDARDLTGREAKTAWWQEREELDARLRDLLVNIEKVWLGGFTGIFSQHARRQNLLARFQKSFQNILDKHLPSRQKTGKRSTTPRVTLDSRILDLFIGLGDASDENCDFSEPLTDLLYFVVDVLQFHGEMNAYAEIDFDSIVIETHDALRCYHEAVRASACTDEGSHTILILDKALHAFPWESLPCMDGLAVSRLPSLGSLRDRILESQKRAQEEGPQGQYISRDNGSYILNPGGDLKSTQSTFLKPLQSLGDWHSIIQQEPTEEEMKSSLESKDLFLYFGHGSGAQYIRAREIRKLDKCAVTMLMGCSSGALTEAGEFEPYGPPVNYMHAGCPALVATLWDVTDKDIDRFAMSTLDHWGLFESSSGKGKGKGKKKAEAAEQKVSLVEAVAKGREACNLRYLNAAAVCVYGIPVYFEK